MYIWAYVYIHTYISIKIYKDYKENNILPPYPLRIYIGCSSNVNKHVPKKRMSLSHFKHIPKVSTSYL